MKITIYKKMMLGFIVVIVLMTIVIGYLLNELRMVSKTAESTILSDVKSIELAKEADQDLYDQESHARKYLITRDVTYYTLFWERSTRFNQVLEQLLGLQTQQEDVRFVSSMQGRHEWFADFMEHHRNTGSLTEPLVPFPADSLTRLHAALSELIRSKEIAVDRALASVSSTTGQSLNVSIILTICAILAAITLALFITRTITFPIGILKRGTEQVARGNFAKITVTSNDELHHLTDAFNDMSEKLKTVNERKADMMQRISHELRNSLQAMLSAHFLLAEQRLGPVNGEQSKLLHSIREGIDQLTSFSNQFLDIAKIEAGMMAYSFERVNILDVVRPAIDQAQLIAAGKTISIDLTLSPTDPVMVDRDKISQVVTNLLSNAIKYTPKNGSIVVNVGPSELGVRIAVQDTGIGIAPEDVPRVFTKFYQAKNATKADVKGTGLGLALVKGLVDGHGGVVTVQSAVGIGSTFTVELPPAPDSTFSTSLRSVDRSNGGARAAAHHV